MKVKVNVRYPTVIITDKDVDIEIPDGEDPEAWIADNMEKIIVDQVGDDFFGTGYSGAIEAGYADVKLIKEE